MKKTYVKPAMAVEMFTLTQTIARACGVDGGVSNHWNEDTCGYYFEGGYIWSNGNCNDPVGQYDVVEALCYNAPSGNVAFSST